MSSRVRARRFGAVSIVTRHERGEYVGSEVRYADLRWHLPHWPDRFLRVEVLPGPALAVTFKDHSHRLLEEADAA